MGKNQQHKAMQRGKGSAEDGPPELSDEPGADVSFHTAEWHAARIAALTTERMSWEDWKKLQKENAAKAAKIAADEEDQMREYRAQLDADRIAKLAKGTNNAHLRTQESKSKQKSKKKSSKSGKDKKKKDKKKKKRKKEDSSSEESSSGRETDHRKRRRASERQSPDTAEDQPASDGPIRLSDFLK